MMTETGKAELTQIRENHKNEQEEKKQGAGCTAVFAYTNGQKLWVANAGDSRAVLGRNGVAIEMSQDHKPNLENERLRIEKAGGRVQAGRINGNLNLSRSLGDFDYKQNSELPAENQMITALPEIKEIDITPEDQFLILACDGVWDIMSS